MGYDVSNHPVDTKLITERLIPALLGNASIDDILDRAADLCVVASRANQWGFRVMQVQHDLGNEQFDAEMERPFLMLPGFESDLSVWGRPFFIVADTVDESLAAFEQYMQCTRQDLAGVDRIAASMLTWLDAKKGSWPADSAPAKVALVEAVYPLAKHLPELKKKDQQLADAGQTRLRLAKILEAYREGWAHRDSKRKIKSDVFDEPAKARDVALEAPYILLNIASQVLPGWMARGTVWPTQLFEKIDVSVSHVFETPAALFEPLVRAFPALEERFRTTIIENYSLGGYVRPENVPVLRALVEKHQRELIFAFVEPHEAAGADLERLSMDYQKILEPVVFAERNGYGCIEAAEIYSGFLGVLN
jgi:hypothetical protein